MPKQIAWFRTVSVKMTGAVIVLVMVTFVLITSSFFIIRSLRSGQARLNEQGKMGRAAYQILYLANRLIHDTGPERLEAAVELRGVAKEVDDVVRTLTHGDPSRGIFPTRDSRLLENLRRRDERWKTRLQPALDRVLAVSSGSEVPKDLLAEMKTLLADHRKDIHEAGELVKLMAEEDITKFKRLLSLLAALALLILGVVFWISRGISSRVTSLGGVAERIARGELEVAAPVTGEDEIAALGEVFNVMTGNLRRMIESEKQARARIERLVQAVAETTNNITSATAEILAGTTQQAAGAQEQASSVAETVSTVDEVLQTADQTAQRAKAVLDSSQRADDIGKTGRKAVEESVTVMGTVKDQSESIAESILALAEQAQAIGEIIASVNDIAEQTNLLALNASIEASRAGEHGKGFSVVASEIKVLADQSKKATAQVRQILGEIQKATNSAVIATEEGTKSVNAAIRVVHQAGETIKTLSETVGGSAQAAAQIAASSSQQVTGMSQIHQAMKNVNQVTNQNVASTKQAERAAQDLNALAGKLKEMVSA